MASILDRVKALIVKQAQNTNLQYNKALYNWLGNSIVWNQENDDSYIQQGYQRNATVYSIINLISKAATTIPLQVYEVKSSADAKRYKSFTSGHLDASAMHTANILRKKAFVEVSDTPLQKLLERPNPAQSYNAWLTELVSFGKLTGNRFIFGIGPDSGPNVGRYTELYVLPSQNVEIVSGGIMEPVSQYKLQYNGNFYADADSVCHIKDFNPDYDGTGTHLYGQSPLRAGLRSLTVNNDAVTTGAKYLQNQMARGVLMSDDGDINEVQAQQLKDKFRQNYQGSNNAGDVVISPRKLSWINFGLPASDLALIEQYNATIKDICNIYNIPVQLLNNTDTSTYNNMKEAKKALYQNAVIPELIKLRDELNRWLVPKYGANLYIDFDFTAIPEMQEDIDKLVSQMANAWWTTPNEKREAMYYGRIEDEKLDQFYMPANLMPMEPSLAALEAPKAFDLDLQQFKAQK